MRLSSPLLLALALLVVSCGPKTDTAAAPASEPAKPADKPVAASTPATPGVSTEEDRNALANAKQVAIAVQMLLVDKDDIFGDMSDPAAIAKSLHPYFGTTKNGPELEAAAATYVWNKSLSKKPVASLDAPAKTWVFHAAQPAADGTYLVSYCDANVKNVSKDDLAKLE